MATVTACFTLRIRGPNGTATLRGALQNTVDDVVVAKVTNYGRAKLLLCEQRKELGPDAQNIPRDLRLDEFRKRVAETCGVPESAQQFKAGFPPQPLPMDLEAIDGWGLQNGDALVLQASTSSSVPSGPTQAMGPSPHSGGGARIGKTPGGLPDGRIVTRRIIDSDNSCLFNAVGYSTERSRKEALKLRKVVQSTVAQDPLQFNEGFLGKDNVAYQEWIMNPQHWGGAIELYILSMHYGCEISAFDIQTKRVDTYGQDQGYDQRCFVVYDGLHYDALAIAAFPDAPEEVDCTLVDIHSPEVEQIMDAASSLVDALHKQRAFTDTSTFTLRCAVCGIGLKGEKEALEHARLTGHQNFQEYR